MTTSDIQQAKEWAESRANGNYALSEETRAVVKVIQSLPDQWIDAEKVRELVEKADEGFYSAGSFLRRMKELLPTPPLQTLADMSLEELKDYIGVKVTVDGWANPSMLVAVIGDEGAVLAHRLNRPWPFVEVRPLSDLAPVEAPGQEAESTPESVQPRPEDVPAGEPWIVRYEGEEWVGARAKGHDFVPWFIMRMDGLDDHVVSDSEIALISRLVPERKESA